MCSVVGSIAREESLDRANVTVASGSGIDAEESPPPPARTPPLPGKSTGFEAVNTTGETKRRL